MSILEGYFNLWAVQLLLSLKWGHRLARQLIQRRIDQSGLFDADYYREQNPDVAASDIPLLAHYVRYGDREGRWPNPLFDPCHYRAAAGLLSPNICALFHYVAIGFQQPVRLSSWFDNGFYRQQNKDVARAGINPLFHFFKLGGRAGRSPSAEFNCSLYLHEHPDVEESGLNPLLHYIKHGKAEGRKCSVKCSDSLIGGVTSAELFRERTCPDPDRLEAQAAMLTAEPKVDVVIPVYGDRLLTWRCLASVLTAECRTPFRVVVVDDCTPDPDIASDLNTLAARGLITLLKNQKNRGFVASVNRGMRASNVHDVVLLNADTEVYAGWLDRLRAVAQSEDDVASVTPMSNNATICSYPRFCEDNPYPLEIDFAKLDELCAEHNARFVVDAPTAVGFCMYITRIVLNRVGLFDENTFGRGYGEENDWSQRAIRAGYRNLLSADTFVCHHGGASFKGEKGKRVAEALTKINKLYPNYLKEVDSFINADPLAAARERLDWARLRQFSREHNMLLVCHARGGGAERHLQEDALLFEENGTGVFFMRPEGKTGDRVRIQHNACQQLPNLPTFDLRRDTELLVAALERLGITGIHSHGLVDFSAEAPTLLQSLAERLDIPLAVDIHDYKVICPRINLTDKHGRYCGEPDATQCNRCLRDNGNDFGVTDIDEWRRRHYGVLRKAAEVIVPDRDVKNRLLNYYPDVEILVSPHEKFEFMPKPRPRLAGERLSIVVIGAIGKIKGYDVVVACARDVRKRKLPVDYFMMGYTMNDAALRKEGVVITGKYQENHALQELRSLNPHAIFFPALSPETYSYTLTLALRSGVPVFGFDIGAIRTRLQDIGWDGGLMPLDLSCKPSEINDFIQSTIGRG